MGVWLYKCTHAESQTKQRGMEDFKNFASDVGLAGLISGWGAKIPYAMQPKNPKHEAEAIL